MSKLVATIIRAVLSIGITFFLSRKVISRHLQNATNRINTAFFTSKRQITPHWIWYNRVDENYKPTPRKELF